MAIAALVVVAILLLRGPRTALGLRNEALLAFAGVTLAIHFAGWIASLEFTSVAIATLLVCTSPIFTGVADAVVARRTPNTFFWIALLCGALGLYFLVAAKSAPAPSAGHGALGAFLAVLGAFAMAVYLIVVRSVRVGFSTLTVVARTYAWAALALIPLTLLAHEGPPPANATSAWFGIVAMALVSQLLGHTAMNSALRYFTPTTVGFSTLLEPVIAAVLAAMIFGETLGGATLLGAILLLAATGFALKAQTVVVSYQEL